LVTKSLIRPAGRPIDAVIIKTEGNGQMNMTANVGNVDRMLRIGLGILLIVLTLMGTIGIWGWLGLVLIGTGFMRFCPAYRLFGFKTCAT
jgi:hypothetical protein